MCRPYRAPYFFTLTHPLYGVGSVIPPLRGWFLVSPAIFSFFFVLRFLRVLTPPASRVQFLIFAGLSNCSLLIPFTVLVFSV